MKKFGILLFCFGVITLMAYRFIFYEPAVSFNKDGNRFVCIINPETDDYWGEIRKGISDADDEFGSYTKILTFNHSNTEEQIKLLQESVYAHVDGIITVGEPYSEELNNTISQIVDTGIPVVLLDTDSEESGRTCYIGTDNYKAGQLAAQSIADFTGNHAKIVVFITSAEYANQYERLTGFQDIVNEYETMEILEVYETLFDRAALQNELTRIISSYDDLNAIFCAEASTSHLNNVTINEAGRDICVIAFDDVEPVPQLIMDGTYAATIMQDGFSMGYQAVSYLNSNPDPGTKDSAVYTDVTLVTRDNIDKFYE